MSGRPRKVDGPAAPGPDVTPPVPGQSDLPAAPDAAPAGELDALRDRQRRDCEALAGEVARLRSLPDLGAGREGNQAAALGTLTRATAALHDMERSAYGLGMDAAQGRDRVILLPVPVESMADWARQAAQVMGIQPAPASGQSGQVYGARRVKE
jgi:hypothetical protein